MLAYNFSVWIEHSQKIILNVPKGVKKSFLLHRDARMHFANLMKETLEALSLIPSALFPGSFFFKLPIIFVHAAWIWIPLQTFWRYSWTD